MNNETEIALICPQFLWPFFVQKKNMKPRINLQLYIHMLHNSYYTIMYFLFLFSIHFAVCYTIEFAIQFSTSHGIPFIHSQSFSCWIWNVWSTEVHFCLTFTSICSGSCLTWVIILIWSHFRASSTMLHKGHHTISTGFLSHIQGVWKPAIIHFRTKTGSYIHF